MNQLNLNHRVTGKETEEFEITDMTVIELSRSISNMTDRATAQANLLLPYYDCMSEQQPDTRTVYFALNSIMLDLADVQKTVEAFALANKATDQT